MTIHDLNKDDIFEWNGSLYRVTDEWDGDTPYVEEIAKYWPNGRGAGTPPTWVACSQIHKWNPCCNVNSTFCTPTKG